MTLSNPKAYFSNDLADYKEGDDITVEVKTWKKLLIAMIEHRITEEMPPILGRSEGSLYVGNAGLAYMYFHISMLNLFQQERWEYLRCGREYFNIALEYTRFYQKDEDLGPSLMLGAAGTYMVGALVSNALDDTETCQKCVAAYLDLARHCIKPTFFKLGANELFVGRAGYLCGILNMQRWLGRQIIDDGQLKTLCHMIVETGREYAKSHHSGSPLMYSYYGTEYLGAAHGLSSILLMLMSFPEYLRAQPLAEQHIRQSVDYLLSLQQPNLNFPTSMDEVKGAFHRPEADEQVHWCHGAPGVIYLFAKAYRLWGDEKYLQACVECGEITWKKGLLRKGPGLCHGVAGSGYVFLVLYRLTEDVKFLHRALQFARFMLSTEFRNFSKIPDSPFSLFEGWSGAVCFLADVAQPQKAAFPLFDIFEM